jgi:hypothetical protein
MPKAIAIPTGFSFRHKFEELPLFWQYTAGTCWRTGRIDGEFEVTVETTGDWIFSDVKLCVDNGGTAKEAKGDLLPLDSEADERFYLLVLDSLDHRYAGYIDERIRDEAAEYGLRLVA